MSFIPKEQKEKYLYDIHVKYLLECYERSCIFLKRKMALKYQKELKTKYGVNIPLYEREKMLFLCFYRRMKTYIREIIC